MIAWLSRWPVCVAVITVLAEAPALLRGLVSRNAVVTSRRRAAVWRRDVVLEPVAATAG